MPATAHPEHRVLIATDDPSQTKLLQSFLAEMNCEITTALDQQDTLAKAASFEPHLILLDLANANSNGFDVCRQLKRDTSTRGIRILMLTSMNDLRDIEQVVDAEADDFLSKPVNSPELVRRVKNLLGL